MALGGRGCHGGGPRASPQELLWFGLFVLFGGSWLDCNPPHPAAFPLRPPIPPIPTPTRPTRCPSPPNLSPRPLGSPVLPPPPPCGCPTLIHHPPPSPDPPPRTSLPFPLTGPLSVCLSLRNAPPAVWGGPCPLFYQLMGGSVPYPTPLGPPPVLFCLAQGSHLGSCISAGSWATLGRLEGGTRRPLHGGEPRSNMGASPAPPVWGWGPNPGELGLQDEPYSRAGF